MKSKSLQITLLLASLVFTIGCGSENKQIVPIGGGPTAPVPPQPGGPGGTNPPVVVPTPTPDSSGTNPLPTPTINSSGETVVIQDVDPAVFANYLGRPINKYSDIHLNLKVAPQGTTPQVFYGYAKIRYVEDPGYGTFTTREGFFNNGDDFKGNRVHVYVTSGTPIPSYRFFFEDEFGVIIVTLTEKPLSDTGGDLDGKVYYRNFNTPAPNPLFKPYWDGMSYWPSNPQAYCWSGKITAGPYDCRNFNVDPTTGDKQFKFLGNIKDLDRTKALGL